MKRLPDWSMRLSRYVESRRAEPFKWGRNDCVLFAFGGIDAMTGSRLTAEMHAIYSDRRSGVRALRARGGMRAGTTAYLGEPGPVLLSRIGDVGLLPNGALGICNGDTWLAPGPREMSAVPLASAVCAWRVG